jgi:hypothetical protein
VVVLSADIGGIVDIWHWKYRSLLQTGTQLWQGLTSQWDYNPTPLDNWISNHNTDINKN